MLINKRDYILPISGAEGIVIRPCGPITLMQMHCCNLARIYLFKDNTYFNLFDSSIPFFHEPFNQLSILLIKALANELSIPNTMNIGYAYNELQMKNNRKFFMVKTKLPENFDIYDYKLWSSSRNTTWLYNNSEGEVILQVTSNYPWSAYRKGIKNLITFEKFLKNYKPSLEVTIPQDVAYQWLNEIAHITEGIRENVERIRRIRNNQSLSESESKSDFPKMPQLLWDVYGYFRNDLSDAHKNVFSKAGLDKYAHWWEHLTDTQKAFLNKYDYENQKRVYEEMP